MKKNWKYWIFWGLAMLVTTQAVASPQDAVMQVRENAKEVLTILGKSNGSNDRAVREEAERYALPYFDFQRMTALAVGLPWKQANDRQRKELVNAFQILLIRTYSGTMLRFKDAKVTVKDEPIVQKNGREVVVQTEVLPADSSTNQTVKMDYTMYQSAGKYRVYNISVEGASLVTVYRKQFNDTIAKSGIDGLIKELQAKDHSGAGQ